MATIFNKTQSIPEFKASNGVATIEVKHSASGKPYAVSNNGIEFKMSASAELALSDPATAGTVRISSCTDEDKDFFMIHVKKDEGTVIFTI